MNNYNLNSNGFIPNMNLFDAFTTNMAWYNGIDPIDCPSSDSQSYGYAYGYESCAGRRGNVSSVVNEVTLRMGAFKTNTSVGAMTYEEINSKGKVKIIPISNKIEINYITYVYLFGKEDFEKVVVGYTANNQQYCVIIPAEDYYKTKFSKYFKGVTKYPGCSKALLNELIAYLIETTTNAYNFYVYPHQGWIQLNEDTMAFAALSETKGLQMIFATESVLRRKAYRINRSAEDIVGEWEEIYGTNGILRFIGLYMLTSLFRFFLDEVGVCPFQLLVISPSSELNEEKLTAMISTNDIDLYPPPVLEIGKDALIRELGYIYDGVALFVDHSFVDEADKLNSSVKLLVKAVRNDLAGIDNGRNLIAIISDNAAYTAKRYSPENVIHISTDGIQLNFDKDKIRKATEGMIALVINTILTHNTEAKEFFALNAQDLRKHLSVFFSGQALNTAVMIFLVERFLSKFVGITVLGDDDINEMVSILNDKGDRIVSADQAILNDFAANLSEYLRSEKYSVLEKRKNMTVKDGMVGIVSANRLYIGDDIINEILSIMKTTHSKKSLIKAFKHNGTLNSTDGNTHPVEVHDFNGKHQRLYLYDISTDILDADVIHKLANLDSEAFFLNKSEVPSKDFLSIITDNSDRVVGRHICYLDEENGHVYITGQSGYGKTYLMCQLLAKCFKLNHQLVVFDSSDSFIYNSLCRNLSKKFVDEYIYIHDLDHDGIPIDLLRVDRNVGLPSQKKQLLGILTAGIGELSAPQSNTLRSVLSSILSVKNEDKTIRTGDILAMLNEEGSTYESLRNRLEPLFEDINECGMSDRSWREFLRETKKIIIIRTDTAFTENGNQLIDMMLATLYNSQRDNPTIPLDVFIDEIQNQNFSKLGAICKVLKEGRKIHMSFFGATQDYYPRNTELGSVMSKADTQLFLRPTPNSNSVVASELHYGKGDMSRFDLMKRGDCIIKGNFYSKEQKRNIPATICGKVDSYPKIPDNYCGNTL